MDVTELGSTKDLHLGSLFQGVGAFYLKRKLDAHMLLE